jgi:aminoglycoside phosphotransferase (APT) family kinase protein
VARESRTSDVPDVIAASSVATSGFSQSVANAEWPSVDPKDSQLIHRNARDKNRVSSVRGRVLLINGDASPAGVIDWGDVCRADPSIDLSLYWSLLSPAAREALRDAYGPVRGEQLLRARVLSLFVNAMLVIYAHTEGLRALECETIVGLQRTIVE